ncbi:MAG: hypothetical protein LW699_03185 [Pirellula sp.]|nr:hypothetical protein [Pirellula sp.]
MRPPSFLKTNAHHDPSNAAGVPVSRLGASRGHGHKPRTDPIVLHRQESHK